MQTVQFPSTKAAWHFVEDAQAQGYPARMPDAVQLLPRVTAWAIVIGALVGGLLFATIGGLAEAGRLGLPRLEPLFASPTGAVTALLATIGGSLGALVGGFVGLKPLPPLAERSSANVIIDDGVLDDEKAMAQLDKIAAQYHGQRNASPIGEFNAEHNGEPAEPDEQRSHAHRQEHQQHASKLTFTRILAWLITVITAAILLQATSYIWFLSMNYGTGSDQQSRIGYTMKNVQRIPADTPEQAGEALATILGGETLAAPADPIAAAILAPIAAAQGQTLLYGAGDGSVDAELLRQLAAQTDVMVVIAEEDAAYALPAAYTAALFRVPVVPLSQVAGVLAEGQVGRGEERLLLLAAPERLVDDAQMAELTAYGSVERVASDNIYRHALLWARGRWGNFGWGIDERAQVDGYFNFTLANPADPAFAAAGLPMAYQGNFGPLLYTPHDDLDELTDQYLWRIAPDWFVIPSDGPFINVRVVGGPEQVSYEAQARADLALETHSYRNQMAGASGAAVAGWIWFFPGLVGFMWALFAIPRRLPDTGFYPRLYWPLAMLTLGPLGILAFFLTYQGRPAEQNGMMAAYVRPLWSQTIAATIMGMGIGMSLMIASMYLFQYFGLPVVTRLAFTPFNWLGAPMDAFMWVLMVIPAIIISIFLFMGPMQADMQRQGYWHGVRKATPIVIASMVAASIGMFSFSYWTMNWENLMAGEDLWLWITPLWLAAACGFFAALIPNYWMVRAGWKMGGM